MYRLIVLVLLLPALPSFGQRNIDVQHYRYEIELSDRSDAITGRALITVKFFSEATEIQFDLVSVQDDKGMYAFQVKEDDQLLNSNHRENVLRISLQRPAKIGEERRFEISYMGTPADGLIISQNKYGDRTFFADNWPDRAHNWIPCIDAPDDKASFEFIVTAPRHYQVVSNGLKTEETLLDGDRKRTHWKEDIPLPTKVMVIGAADFATREFPDSPPGLPVSAWVYPQDSMPGFYDYGVAPEIVKFFSGYIAPFPYKKLANVQSKTIFGGMENASAIFYAEESVTGDRKWEDVMAHEIAHQWFGDMASEKSFAHLWLSEGFATYLTDIYIEKKYGRDSALKRLQKEKEDVIRFVKRTDHPVVDSTSNLMSLLNANSYQKGAWVLHMLRNEVGDTLFRKIIQAYYQQYQGGNADTRDFQKIAETVSGQDLGWFFDQWLYRPGIPELKIQKKADRDGIKVTITQGRQLYRFHLDLLVTPDKGGPLRQRLWITDKETVFKFKSNGPGKVTVDPEGQLLYAGE